MGGSKDVMNS